MDEAKIWIFKTKTKTSCFKTNIKTKTNSKTKTVKIESLRRHDSKI